MIAISKCDRKFEAYIKWLEYFNVSYVILDYNVAADLHKLNSCNGLILSGGEDISPEIYCDWRENNTEQFYNPKRDGFELRLLETAVNLSMPILGICRGAQLINVFFKGNLIFDLETIRKVNHRKISDNEPLYHNIIVYEDTLLYSVVKTKSGVVTSSHHQAVDRLGEGLKVNCRADDGTVEGIETINSDVHFLLGIQWHPERFADFNSPFSRDLLLKFITESEKYAG